MQSKGRTKVGRCSKIKDTAAIAATKEEKP